MAASRRPRSRVIAKNRAVRVERDSIGELGLPADALYGIQTARAVSNLSFSGRSLSGYPIYLSALAHVKKAAARANRDAGILSAQQCRAIENACDQIAAGENRDQFPVDMLAGGGSIAINMNLNEVIANLANESLSARRGKNRPLHPKTHVNASQSTADVCHTASRMAILQGWTALKTALTNCASAYQKKSVELRAVKMLARTCLNDAGETSMGAFFSAHAAVLSRRAEALATAMRALTRVNLGGTVIGSGAGASPKYRRAVLRHLNALTKQTLSLRDNLYDAAQNVDDLAQVAAQLGLLAEVMIKLAQDLRLLASGPKGGFGELSLPATQEGSSFFAGKINPVIPETMIQCCFQVLGHERTARLAFERGELNLNIFEGAAVTNIFEAMTMLTNALPIYAHCVRGITANVDRCRELASFAR